LQAGPARTVLIASVAFDVTRPPSDDRLVADALGGLGRRSKQEHSCGPKVDGAELTCVVAETLPASRYVAEHNDGRADAGGSRRRSSRWTPTGRPRARRAVR
jgi:hypothetical protein